MSEKDQNLENKKAVKLEKKSKKRKNKSWKPSPIVYAISVIVMLVVIFFSYKLYSLISGYTFVPEKYIQYVLYGLLGFNIFFGIIAFLPNVNNLNKILQTIVCAIMAFVLIEANIIVPTYKGKLERAFTEVPSEGQMTINVYALADNESYSDVSSLKGATIGWQTSIDVEYQEYALKVFDKELSGDSDIITKEYDSIYSLAEALYSGDVDLIMFNQSYADIIASNDDFLDFNTKTKIVYSCMQQITLSYDSNAVGNITTEPFIVLVGGNDSWSYDNVNQYYQAGRTDVNMLAVVNPNTKQILLVTIPRDTYVPLWGNTNCMDKLTHATVYSIDCWKQAVNALLDIDINYYVRINFASLINIVDAVGGIDIYNPDKFYTEAVVLWSVYHKDVRDPMTFEIGELHLDGDHALGYARERHNLPNGDKDRNRHQAIIIKALIDKITSVSIISHISDLFDAISGTFSTDLSMDQIYGLVQMQLDDMATWNLVSYGINGSSGLYHSYAMGQDLSIVIASESTLNQAKAYINAVLNNEVVTIEQ